VNDWLKEAKMEAHKLACYGKDSVIVLTLDDGEITRLISMLLDIDPARWSECRSVINQLKPLSKAYASTCDKVNDQQTEAEMSNAEYEAIRVLEARIAKLEQSQLSIGSGAIDELKAQLKDAEDCQSDWCRRCCYAEDRAKGLKATLEKVKAEILYVQTYTEAHRIELGTPTSVYNAVKEAVDLASSALNKTDAEWACVNCKEEYHNKERCPDCNSKACWDFATQTCHAPECCEETCCNPESKSRTEGWPNCNRCGSLIEPDDGGMCDDCIVGPWNDAPDCNTETKAEELSCSCGIVIGLHDEGMCDDCYQEYNDNRYDDDHMEPAEYLTPAQEELGQVMRGEDQHAKACCKCGSEDLLVRWQEARPYGGYTNNKEHLQVVCRNCQYTWDEPTLDAKGTDASTGSQAKPS
jgi:hypothetical protein